MEAVAKTLKVHFFDYSYAMSDNHMIQFELSPYQYDHPDRDTARGLCVSISWESLNVAEQALNGGAEFSGDSDVVEAVAQAIGFEIPILQDVDFIEAHVDDWGEYWIYSMPEYKELNDDFIEVIL